jgi:ankyrin repeat protein
LLGQVGSGEDDNGPSVELDIKDHKRNDTALHRSIMHNNVAAFEALTDAGADLMIVNKPPDRKDAMTPLLAALAKVRRPSPHPHRPPWCHTPLHNPINHIRHHP